MTQLLWTAKTVSASLSAIDSSTGGAASAASAVRDSTSLEPDIRTVGVPLDGFAYATPGVEAVEASGACVIRSSTAPSPSDSAAEPVGKTVYSVDPVEVRTAMDSMARATLPSSVTDQAFPGSSPVSLCPWSLV